jgi:predicted Zn-dependent peptidase
MEKSKSIPRRNRPVPQEVFHHVFDNGLTLLAERMDHVRSAAFNFLVPAGCVYDPPDQVGTASVLSEMIIRGAGDRDSRALSLALDNLGLDRDESVGQYHLRFWGSTLARNVLPALEIYADILRKPHLPADELEAVLSLAEQDLQSLEDEPRQKVMVELRRRHWPMPLGRDRRGTLESLGRIKAAGLKKHFQKRFSPSGTILSVAGNIEWAALKDKVARHYGDWKGEPPPAFGMEPSIGGVGHLEKETTQTQIALAYPSVPFGHPSYYTAQGAVQVLSGGMAARLFTEVREKRGLCYSVYASYQTFKDRACILGYAGTTNERAQETLDVTLGEFRRLGDGVAIDEVQRVQAGLKSSVIMAEESTSARAGALASDWYYLGRVRPVEEVQAAINGLTPEAIVDYVKKYPPANMTVVTLGPKGLVVN